MLCLNLMPGEYMTIGDSVVVQLDRIAGDRCKLMIVAPREIPILRGEVLERIGGERPSCVVEGPRWHRREIPWNRSKAQALAAMRMVSGQAASCLMRACSASAVSRPRSAVPGAGTASPSCASFSTREQIRAWAYST